MIDNLIKELEELKKLKVKYENRESDMKRMSDELYKYMLKDYENASKEKLIKEHENEICKCCRFRYDCEGCRNVKDIFKPIPSEKNFIPGRIICKDFKWE